MESLQFKNWNHIFVAQLESQSILVVIILVKVKL